MGLYDLQNDLESVLNLALTLTETNALVRQFSSRSDRLIDWHDFVTWFWSLSREAQTAQRKREAQQQFMRVHSREANPNAQARAGGGERNAEAESGWAPASPRDKSKVKR